MVPKGKKQKNFTTTEMETIVCEVEARKGILLKSVSSGVTMVKKNK